jgi:DNA (cytosine-5)-methyltransferase 1
MPTFGSLFAGIGGIDLGLERAGWECRWQVEWDEFCQHVLAHHWPDVPRYGDITAVDWTGVERVDLIAGGFPCQPFSLAGQRRGKDDVRWLWPEFATAVRLLRPRHVLVENVPGLLAGHGGMGDVLGDLARLGYDAEWDSVPAAAVGAPHLRYRVWIVAHAHDVGGLGLGGLFDGFRPALGDDADGRRGPAAMADADGTGLEGRQLQPERADQRPAGAGGLADANRERQQAGRAERGHGVPPSRSEDDRHPTAGGSHGAVGDWWLTEPDVGRVAHGVPGRVERLRALGNAVVPQVVEVIGRQLLAAIEDPA